MNPDPDYSAAYVILRTDAGDGLEGHGLTFTIGRGTEVVVAAVEALRPLVVGLDVEATERDLGAFWRAMVGDSQLRWIGPEKGAIHLATAAVVNAVWDLVAKRAGKPVWRLLADMTPAEIVALVDFRYLTDALTPEQALALLEAAVPGREARTAELLADGYPAYTTSVGWLGYDDAKVRRLAREALADGWTRFKMKVGADVEDDVRRAAILREELGPGPYARGGREPALGRRARRSRGWTGSARSTRTGSRSRRAPTTSWATRRSPRGVAPIRVATGEHVQNRIMFKQFLAAGAMAVCQIDACRLGGVNEVVAVLLLAARFGVPVCPHAGGVGLCELVQHLAAFDYIAVSGSLDGRMVEYVDHLHEHFLDPVVDPARLLRPAVAARVLGGDPPRDARPVPLPRRPRVGMTARRRIVRRQRSAAYPVSST